MRFLIVFYCAFDDLPNDKTQAKSVNPILQECACSFEDTDEDGYDDVSFDEGYISGTSAGDVNLDGNLNITDIILYIEAILAD